jgi:hypothetical protein
MSTYVNLPGGPASVVRIGLKLRALASDLQSQTAPLLRHIKEMDANPPAPWGADDPGTDLLKRYTQPTEIGPFNESLHTQLRDSGQALGQIADIILDSMASIQNADIDSARDIKSV